MLASYPVKRSALVPMLMYAQDEVGSLTDEVIAEIASRLDLTVLQVNEVIGYYSMMHKKPLGKYHVQVCTNISCMLRGGFKLWDHAQKTLGLKHKQVDAEGRFSLEEVECIGSCCWRPCDASELRLLSRRDAGKLRPHRQRPTQERRAGK